jgi:hypothetical protein
VIHFYATLKCDVPGCYRTADVAVQIQRRDRMILDMSFEAMPEGWREEYEMSGRIRNICCLHSGEEPKR